MTINLYLKMYSEYFAPTGLILLLMDIVYKYYRSSAAKGLLQRSKKFIEIDCLFKFRAASQRHILIFSNNSFSKI